MSNRSIIKISTLKCKKMKTTDYFIYLNFENLFGFTVKEPSVSQRNNILTDEVKFHQLVPDYPNV